MKKNEMIAKIEQSKARSAWQRGVKNYAVDLLGEGLDSEELPRSWNELKTLLLNGAKNFSEYSWGGLALVYDGDIAAALCTPSELKKKKGGQLAPNSREQWLDVQARALYQAAQLIRSLNN